MDDSAPEPAPIYLQLRQYVLGLDPAELGFEAGSLGHAVYGVIMESSYPVGSATLTALADGTTSLYYSTGGGMLGSSDFAPLAQASQALVAAAESQLAHFTPASDESLPEVGMVRFTLLTFEGRLSASDSQSNLAAGTAWLFPVYAAAQQTLTQLRLLSEKKGKSA